jgi:hypothetical protein
VDSGTPSFLVKLMQERGLLVLDLESDIAVGIAFQENHQLGSIDTVALLLQTGYLTVDYYDQAKRKYHLCIPNEEVRRSLLKPPFQRLQVP